MSYKNDRIYRYKNSAKFLLAWILRCRKEFALAMGKPQPIVLCCFLCKGREFSLTRPPIYQ